MPVKPENRSRYPRNWLSEIRPAIMERAGFQCEHPGCTARHYAVGTWMFQPAARINWLEMAPPPPFVTLPFTGFRDQCQRAAELHFDRFGDGPAPPGRGIVVIVLTVAHLDHTPENCSPENLRAWCQRHHLAYDHQHHRASAYSTRMARRGNLELPL